MKSSELVRQDVKAVSETIAACDVSQAVRIALAKEAFTDLFADFGENLEFDSIDLAEIASSALSYMGVGLSDLRNAHHPDECNPYGVSNRDSGSKP